MYDPIQADKPYGFIEVKCPYSSRNLSPAEACENSDFFCMYDQDSNQLKLKKAHKYFAQRYRARWPSVSVHGVIWLFIPLKGSVWKELTLIMTSGCSSYCQSSDHSMMTVYFLKLSALSITLAFPLETFLSSKA